MDDCGRTYRMASDHIKKMLNQIMFTRLWVNSDGSITPQFAKPFDSLAASMGSIASEYAKEARECESTTGFLSSTPNLLSSFFGQGLTKNILVDHTGLEPATTWL